MLEVDAKGTSLKIPKLESERDREKVTKERGSRVATRKIKLHPPDGRGSSIALPDVRKCALELQPSSEDDTGSDRETRKKREQVELVTVPE